MRRNDVSDIMALVWLFIMVVTVLIMYSLLFASDDHTCPEYGTVLVTVDDEQRCVPWEQAPVLQDFPEPK